MVGPLNRHLAGRWGICALVRWSRPPNDGGGSCDSDKADHLMAIRVVGADVNRPAQIVKTPVRVAVQQQGVSLGPQHGGVRSVEVHRVLRGPQRGLDQSPAVRTIVDEGARIVTERLPGKGAGKAGVETGRLLKPLQSLRHAIRCKPHRLADTHMVSLSSIEVLCGDRQRTARLGRSDLHLDGLDDLVGQAADQVREIRAVLNERLGPDQSAVRRLYQFNAHRN